MTGRVREQTCAVSVSCDPAQFEAEDAVGDTAAMPCSEAYFTPVGKPRRLVDGATSDVRRRAPAPRAALSAIAVLPPLEHRYTTVYTTSDVH